MKYFDISKLTKIPFRQKQFDHAVFKDFVTDINHIQTLPKELRKEILQALTFPSIKPVKESKEKETLKVLFEYTDRSQIESVLLYHDNNRHTVCVSTQVGCPLACSFCATGQMGFTRNLTPQEIVDQVLYFARLLKAQDQRVTNIVFMGMGEPFLNHENTVSAVEILIDPEQFGLGSRHITISTVGLIDQMQQFFEKFPQINLAISLHAASEEKREKLMKTAAQTKLSDLAEAIASLISKYNRRITLEYLLIKDINDTNDDISDLTKFIISIGEKSKKLIHVNLIPYNEIQGIPYTPTSPSRVREFRDKLTESGINTTIRKSLGQDSKAACGMLKAATSE